MDFSFSEEQLLLRDMVRDLAGRRFGSSVAREAMAGNWQGLDQAWSELADLGLAGLVVEERLGGGGAGLVEACLVVEELTRGLAPVPFAGSAVVAARALQHLSQPPDRDRLLGELAQGRRFALVLGADGRWPGEGSSGLVLQWSPGAIPLLASGTTLEVLDPSTPEPLPTQELLHRSARVEASAAPVQDADGVARTRAAARVISAAAMLGAMGAALDMSVAYAKEREQFGSKIGAFQAVRHMCAEMLVDYESSHSAVYGAAWHVDAAKDPTQAARLGAIAHAWLGECSVRVCETAVQVHGGIGCTWESDVHLFLRTARIEASRFGGASGALDAVALAAIDGGAG